MGISKHPSVVTMPKTEKPYPSILAFLCRKFPAISRDIWESRISEGKVLDEQGHRITLDTEYAAGFWTNNSEHPNALGSVRAGIPRDAYYASGNLGQRCVIIPSQHMVVVRMGDSVDPSGDMRGLTRLIKDVIAATDK